MVHAKVDRCVKYFSLADSCSYAAWDLFSDDRHDNELIL
jgi:hypothetical protein